MNANNNKRSSRKWNDNGCEVVIEQVITGTHLSRRDVSRDSEGKELAVMAVQ